MIRALLSILVLTGASVSFAAVKCENIKLSCRVVYAAYDGAAEVETAETYFGNENWDEPSLENCAATTYFKRGNTSIRIYANKDLDSDIVSVSAMASQVEKIEINGQPMTKAEYSPTASAYASLGMIQNLGALSLPKAIPMGDSMVKSVYVGCTAK